MDFAPVSDKFFRLAKRLAGGVFTEAADWNNRISGCMFLADG